MTDYKSRTIQEIIVAHTVNQDSFIGGEGKSMLKDCVAEINTNIKDKLIDIVDSIQAGGIGLDSGVVGVSKDVVKKAISRSSF